MAAEALLAGAFCAGVIEGRSILRNAKKTSESSWPPGPFLLVPSLLYGTFALPMSIIGASPGHKIVSSFPFCPPLHVLQQVKEGKNEMTQQQQQQPPLSPSQSMVGIQQQEVNSIGGAIQSTTNNVSSVATTSRRNQFRTTTEVSSSPTLDKRSEWIQKSREQNRKALAERQQQQQQMVMIQHEQQQKQQPQIITSVKKVEPEALTSKTNKFPPARSYGYFATLDGKPLPIPLAEAMRRSRVLLVTAGLVTAALTYQQQLREEEEKTKLLQRQGRDVQAVTNYVESQPKNDGVAIRLECFRPSMMDLKPQQYTPWYGTNVIPFVSSSPTNHHDHDGGRLIPLIDLETTTTSTCINVVKESDGRSSTHATRWSVQDVKDMFSMENIQPILDQVRYDPNIPLPDQFMKVYSLLHDMAMTFKESHEQTQKERLPHPYWYLGTTWNDWSQMPLSNDWLLQPTSNNNGAKEEENNALEYPSPMLVVEADVSLPFKSCFEHYRQRRRHNSPIVDQDSLESARSMSRVIRSIGQQKGIIVTKPDNNNASSSATAASLIKVFVASDGATNVEALQSVTGTIPMTNNEIFVNGLDATASQVTLWAESNYEKLQKEFVDSAQEESEQKTNAVDDEEEEEGKRSTFVLVSLIDFLGEKIRQSGEIILRVFTAPRVPKVLHVFSDQRNAVDWLRDELYRKGWIVKWHDISSDDDDDDENLVDRYNGTMSNGGFAVVCRNTDERTCAFVSTILSSSSSKAHDKSATTELLVLLDRSSSEPSVKGLAKDFSQTAPTITTLSLASIHNNLFHKVRNSLKHHD